MKLLNLAKTILILLVFGLIAYRLLNHTTEQPKVLVVHSYNKDLAWVNEINEGISRAMNASGVPTLNVRTHYMNLKNHPSCHYYKNAAADVRFTIDEWRPDAILLVDDLAQSLVGFNQLKFTDNFDRQSQAEVLNERVSQGKCETPALSYFGLDNPQTENFSQLFFAGINGHFEEYAYDKASNVQGILEHKNYTALLETLVTLNESSEEKALNVQMINDSSLTADSENQAFNRQDWSPFVKVEAAALTTFNQWQAAVKKANENATQLLISNYQNVIDEHGALIPPAELIAWTERHARYPVLGANTNFVADGGMMTVAISGVEQGQVAMQFAIAKLLGQDTEKSVSAKQFVIGMNQSLVRKRNLALPGIYEAFSREVGQFIDVENDLYMEQGGTL